MSLIKFTTHAIRNIFDDKQHKEDMPGDNKNDLSGMTFVWSYCSYVCWPINTRKTQVSSESVVAFIVFTSCSVFSLDTVGRYEKRALL